MTCEVEGCTKDNWCRGMCQMHYTRVRRYGDPHFTKQYMDPVERLLAYSEPGPGGCRLYTRGRASRSGHRQIAFEGKSVGAHRVAWILANGQIPGSRHGRAKLSEWQVIEIRGRYAAGGTSQQALADEYGVSQRLIWYVIHEGWRHIQVASN